MGLFAFAHEQHQPKRNGERPASLTGRAGSLSLLMTCSSSSLERRPRLRLRVGESKGCVPDPSQHSPVEGHGITNGCVSRLSLSFSNGTALQKCLAIAIAIADDPAVPLLLPSRVMSFVEGAYSPRLVCLLPRRGGGRPPRWPPLQRPRAARPSHPPTHSFGGRGKGLGKRSPCDDIYEQGHVLLCLRHLPSPHIYFFPCGGRG